MTHRTHTAGAGVLTLSTRSRQPHSGPAIAVTGTTGFLGSHFLLWLSQHHPTTSYALIRGTSRAERVSKLQSALQAAAEGYRPAPDWEKVATDTRIAQGDMELPSFGVPSADLSALAEAGIRDFWHFAASLNFEEKRRELIRSQNVGGPRHAIELACRIGAERFIYVSTAYTAGSADGHFAEELHSRDRPFANAYEDSKCEAEHLVTRLCRERGLDLRILRPSIVIGSSLTHRPAGTNSGLYGFIRELHRLRRRFEKSEEPTRLLAKPDVRLNFVPIDAVMQDIMTVIDREFAVEPILHLTASDGVPVSLLAERSARELGLRGLLVEPEPSASSPLTSLERILDRRMTFYGSYLRSQKQFARSLPDSWSVSGSAFEHFVREGVQELGALTLRRAARRKTRAVPSPKALTAQALLRSSPARSRHAESLGTYLDDASLTC